MSNIYLNIFKFNHIFHSSNKAHIKYFQTSTIQLILLKKPQLVNQHAFQKQHDINQASHWLFIMDHFSDTRIPPAKFDEYVRSAFIATCSQGVHYVTANLKSNNEPCII